MSTETVVEIIIVSELVREIGAPETLVERILQTELITENVGPRGTPGAPGKDGEQGVQGAPGTDGSSGRDGIDGVQGERGADGAPGRDGVDGRDGAPGADGQDGAAGVDGRDGARGEKGDQGPPGETGPLNPNGVTGPASSVDNALARFDGVTGKIVQEAKTSIADSGALIVSVDTGTVGNLVELKLGAAVSFGVSNQGRMTLRNPLGPVAYLDWFGNDRSGSIGLNGTTIQNRGLFQSVVDSGGAPRFQASNSNSVTSFFALYEEGVANVMAQRNGANAQAFRLYNSWVSAVNYERAAFDWQKTPGVLTIGAEAGGTGAVRPVEIVGSTVTVKAPLAADTLMLKAPNGTRWRISVANDGSLSTTAV